jgi:GT2 family glycosyltransferase
VFLNDDLELEPGCLAAMLAEVDKPRVGMTFPMQVAMHNPQLIICGGTGSAYPAGQHKGGLRGQAWREPTPVRWMPFAAVAFNLDMVRDIGLPDDTMRLWFSDSDYCIRARLQGWHLLYLGDGAVVRHEQSASINAMDTGERERAFLRDQTAFARKWGGGILSEYSV